MNLVKPQESAFALRNAKYVAFRLRMLLAWLTAIIAGADSSISRVMENPPIFIAKTLTFEHSLIVIDAGVINLDPLDIVVLGVIGIKHSASYVRNLDKKLARFQ